MRKIELKELRQNIDFDIDYFFCCASFEERCFSIAQYLDVTRIKNSIVCYNEDQVNSFKGHELKLQEILKASQNLITIRLNSDKPLSTAEALLKELTAIEKIETKRIVVDITTFTHEALLILFRLLSSKKIPSSNITFLYNNASDYAVNEIENSEKWLTVGVKEIRSVIGYSGFMSPLKKNLLIVLVGFEPERTKKLIDNYEPHAISLGVGNDYCADISSAIETNKQKHRELVQQYPNTFTFEFSVLEPSEAAEALKKEIKKFPNYNIIIAPMNNKISTIGAALLALDNTELQLCYVPARYYNTDGYSTPGSKCYIFEI